MDRKNSIKVFLYKTLIEKKKLVSIIEKYGMRIIRPDVSNKKGLFVAPQYPSYDIDVENNIVFDKFDLLCSDIEVIPLNILDCDNFQSMATVFVNEGVFCIPVCTREYNFRYDLDRINEKCVAKSFSKMNIVDFCQKYHVMISDLHFDYTTKNDNTFNNELLNNGEKYITRDIFDVENITIKPYIRNNKFSLGIENLNYHFLCGDTDIEYIEDITEKEIKTVYYSNSKVITPYNVIEIQAFDKTSNMDFAKSVISNSDNDKLKISYIDDTNLKQKLIEKGLFTLSLKNLNQVYNVIKGSKMATYIEDIFGLKAQGRDEKNKSERYVIFDYPTPCVANMIRDKEKYGNYTDFMTFMISIDQAKELSEWFMWKVDATYQCYTAPDFRRFNNEEIGKNCELETESLILDLQTTLPKIYNRCAINYAINKDRKYVPLTIKYCWVYNTLPTKDSFPKWFGDDANLGDAGYSIYDLISLYGKDKLKSRHSTRNLMAYDYNTLLHKYGLD